MYTTIIHPLRKAYNLSLNEYCVLEAIRTLSNNTKYQGWCLMSQDRIAKALDVSRRWMTQCYSSLERKGLIERRRESEQDTAVRTVDEWNEWFMADKADILMGLKTKDNILQTIQPRESTLEPHTPSGSIAESARGIEQSARGIAESASNINRDIKSNTKETISPNGDTANAEKPKQTKKEKNQYGKQELNNLKAFLLEQFGLADFHESQKMQRRWLQHTYSMVKKKPDYQRWIIRAIGKMKKDNLTYTKIESIYKTLKTIKL